MVDEFKSVCEVKKSGSLRKLRLKKIFASTLVV